MSEDSIVIVPMTTAHVPMVVDVHVASFAEAFLSFLGPGFLTLLYEGAATSPYGVGVVALDLDDRRKPVVGFTVGMLNPAAFYQQLLRERGWRFALAAVSGVVRRPMIVLRLLRARRYPSHTPRGDRIATLGSIGIRPDYQGRGLGHRLVQGFLEAARARGARQVNLTTDGENNDAVNDFYRRLGFTCTQSFCTPEGRQMNEYEIMLSES